MLYRQFSTQNSAYKISFRKITKKKLNPPPKNVLHKTARIFLMQTFEDKASNVRLVQGQESKDGMCMRCGLTLEDWNIVA